MIALVLSMILITEMPPTQVRDLGPVRITMTLSKSSLNLAETLEMRLILEGPTPLEILPEPILLRAKSLSLWSIAQVGADRREPLPNERQRLTRSYRIEPFEVGDLSLDFVPMRVRAGPIGQEFTADFKPTLIPVTSQIGEPNLGLLRPIVPAPPLPTEIISPPSIDHRWIYFGISVVVIAILSVRWRRPTRRLPPAEAALAMLDAADSSEIPCVRLHAILRGFIHDQWGIPIDGDTADELMNRIALMWTETPEEVRELGEIVHTLEQATYAPAAIDSNSPSVAVIRQRIRQWIGQYTKSAASAKARKAGKNRGNG